MNDELNLHAVAPYQRAFVAPETKAVNDQEREVLHLISTASIDRAGDIVDPAGADLANYMKNPIVLRDHSYSTQDIIGRATSIKVDKDGIWARTQFRDTEVGREAFALAKERLGGWSIGFRPLEYESLKDDEGARRGMHFKRWELLEYSQVAIPMNQDIVNNAIQRGLVSKDHAPLFFKIEQAEQAKPADEAAPTRANAEPAPERRRYDVGPAMVAIARARRTLKHDAAADRLNEITRGT